MNRPWLKDGVTMVTSGSTKTSVSSAAGMESLCRRSCILAPRRPRYHESVRQDTETAQAARPLAGQIGPPGAGAPPSTARGPRGRAARAGPALLLVPLHRSREWGRDPGQEVAEGAPRGGRRDLRPPGPARQVRPRYWRLERLLQLRGQAAA